MAPSREGCFWLEFTFQQSCRGRGVGAQHTARCWHWFGFDIVDFDIWFRNSLADQRPWLLQSTDSYSFPFLSQHTIAQPLGTLPGTICAYYWISTSVLLLSALHLNFSSNKHCKKTGPIKSEYLSDSLTQYIITLDKPLNIHTIFSSGKWRYCI